MLTLSFNAMTSYEYIVNLHLKATCVAEIKDSFKLEEDGSTATVHFPSNALSGKHGDEVAKWWTSNYLKSIGLDQMFVFDKLKQYSLVIRYDDIKKDDDYPYEMIPFTIETLNEKTFYRYIVQLKKRV